MTSMHTATVTFPMLGDWFSFSGSPDITVFGFTFHWYGVIIALGFILAVLYCLRRCESFGITQDDVIDMLIGAVPLAIICARAYYVIFNFDLYRDNLADVFKIWQGGLAIYGGIIGAVIGLLIVCKIKKISARAMMDVGAFGLLIGQSVGRWANFVNREAFGRTTDIFCRMGLSNGTTNIYVHPTFLYESLWNFVGFILLHIVSKKTRRKYDGQYFLYYLGWYGLGRMMIEGLRTDSLYLFGTAIRVSQLLAGLSLLWVLIVLFIMHFFRYPQPENLWVNRRAAMAQGEAAADVQADPEAEIASADDTGDEAKDVLPIIESTLADEDIVDAPVVEPIEVILHDSDGQ